MTEIQKQQREAYEFCKPFLRTLLAAILRGSSSITALHVGYQAADDFLYRLEKDLDAVKTDAGAGEDFAGPV